MQTLTIGKLAKAAGVGVETIRYYERKGLIEQPDLPEAGYRQYPANLTDRIRFIKQNQALGFKLKEITAVLRLLDGQGLDCGHAAQVLDLKITEIKQKINELQLLKQCLEQLRMNTGVCGGKGPMKVVADHISKIPLPHIYSKEK